MNLVEKENRDDQEGEQRRPEDREEEASTSAETKSRGTVLDVVSGLGAGEIGVIGF